MPGKARHSEKSAVKRPSGRFELVESDSSGFAVLLVRFRLGAGPYRGEGSSDWADRLNKLIEERCAARPADVLFDVSEMPRLDVFFQHLLVQAYQRGAHAGNVTGVVTPVPKHLDHLRRLKLDSLFPIYASVDEATHELYVDAYAQAQRQRILRSRVLQPLSPLQHICSEDFLVSSGPESPAKYYLVRFSPSRGKARVRDDPLIFENLEARIRPLMQNNPLDVICDFSHLPNLDAYLLGFLFSRVDESRQSGTRLAIVAKAGPAKDVLDAVRFGKKAPIYGSLDDAVADLYGPTSRRTR